MRRMSDEPRAISPDPKPWKFAERERLLRETAEKLPTWRIANQARRHLAGMVKAVSDELEAPSEPTPIDKASAALARKVTAINLGTIIVRSTGAIIALIAAGHERESLAHARISLEALIRGRQMADDKSGDVARKLLAGRKPGTLDAAARRYGDDEDIRFLNRFSHADVLGLLVGSPRPRNGIEFDVELLPQRGAAGPANQLLHAADHASFFSVVVAEVFGVGVLMPPYLSSQLIHFRDNPLPKGM
jgi:hypothetical protein